MTASTTGIGSKGNAASASGNGNDAGERYQPSESDSWLNLRGDEEVQWHGQPRVLPIAPRLLIPVSLSLILLWAIRTYALSGVVLLVSGALIAGCFAVTLWVWRKHASVHYVITNCGMYERRGVFSKTVTHIHLNRIQNTQFRQSVYGRLFGYGDVSIYTAGTSVKELEYECVSSPGEIDSLVSRQLGENQFPKRE